jgi:hypothetical protein
VRIRLQVNGQTYPVAQIGGGRLVFDRPVTFPEATGSIVMTIDGREERWHADIHPASTPTRIITADLTPA